MKIEYSVRPVTRFHVTRWHGGTDANGRDCGGCDSKGEFDSEAAAYEVAYALCREEHRQAGTPPDDPNFQYPKRQEATGHA